jgi:PAS domain S-box-containing protein
MFAPQRSSSRFFGKGCGLLALCSLALFGNWLNVPLLFGVDLIFGSAAVMLAVVYLGIWAAGLVALVGSLYTLVLWGQPVAIPGFVLEGLLVAWMYHRRHLKNLVIADFLYWVVIGIPVVFIVYWAIAGMPGSVVTLIALKQAVNGLFNALLAGLVILLISYQRKQLASMSLSWILFQCMLSAILLAGMTPVLVDAHAQRHTLESAVLEKLNGIAAILENRVQSDPVGTTNRDYHLSRMENMFPSVTIALESDDLDIVTAGRELRSITPALVPEYRSSLDGLRIWLPAGEYNAMQRWKEGYYWIRRPLEGSPGWHVRIEESAAPLVQSMEAKRLSKFSLLAGIFMLSILLAWLISRLLSRPVVRLANASQIIERSVRTGEFAPVSGSIVQEFDQMSSSLNHLGSEIASSVQVLHDSRGRLVKNIAARTRELADTNGLLSSVLDAAEDFSIIATDNQGVITLFNTGAQRLLGYPAEQVVGRETPALLHDPEEVARVGEELTAQHGFDIQGFRVFVHEAEQGQRNPREWTYITRGGQRVPVRLVTSVIRDADGGIAGYLGIAEDVSERKHLEQIKSEFVSTVSHELRTPLTSISGALGMLRSGVLDGMPQRAGEMVALAYNNSQRLTNLINDLLDIEKIAAGKLHFDYQQLGLAEQLDQALVSIVQYAPDQQVTLVPPGQVPAVLINVDPQRLQQVLINLLSNAIKFSSQGGRVALDARLLGDRVRISVSDNGEGIAEAFKAKIFQRFAQADSSDQRKKGGTGLGLAISKELVEHMGGELGFDSILGEGSTFWIDLPCRDAMDKPLGSDKALRASSGQVKVLHVEDDIDLYQVIRQSAGDGFSFRLATTVDEARISLEKEVPDLLLLDIELPDGDGTDLIEEVRQHFPGCSIMILTGHGVEPQLRLRVDAAVLKSALSVPDLLKRINHLTGRLQPDEERVDG